MKIERILKNPEHNGQQGRPHGVKVDFPAWPNDNAPGAPEAPAASYHFKPVDDSPDAAWVADVTNDIHAARLLGINEGYRIYDDGSKKKQPTGDNLPPPPVVGAQAPPPAPLVPIQVSAETVSAERIAEIRQMPVRDLKASINLIQAHELKAAYDAALADPNEKPSKGWVAVIEAQLGTSA